MTATTPQDWYAVRVKSNRERVTSLALSGKGYAVFFPECRRPGGRTESPLFPGYIFCRFDVRNRLPVLSLPGVVHIVGLGRTPVPVDEREMESLRIVVNSDLPVTPEPALAVGQPIRVERGPLAGAGGIVVGLGPRRLVVAISLLQRSVSVELDRDWIGGRDAGWPPGPPPVKLPGEPEFVSRSRQS
jgi:transcription antitermination factor NusG